MTTGIWHNAAQLPTRTSSTNGEDMPMAGEAATSGLRTAASASTIPASGEIPPGETQVNTNAIDGFLQAAQPNPFPTENFCLQTVKEPIP